MCHARSFAIAALSSPRDWCRWSGWRRGAGRGDGVGALDELLSGGWPRAALSEITGRRSSGRTAIVLATLATAIAAGEATALVEGGGGGSLDARAAAACGAGAAGVALDPVRARRKR